MTCLIPKLALPLFVCLTSEDCEQFMIPYGVMFSFELYQQYYGISKTIEIKDIQGNIETKEYRVYESDPIGNILSILIPLNMIFFLKHSSTSTDIVVVVLGVVYGVLGMLHDISIVFGLKQFSTTIMEEIPSETNEIYNDEYCDGDSSITYD